MKFGGCKCLSRLYQNRLNPLACSAYCRMFRPYTQDGRIGPIFGCRCGVNRSLAHALFFVLSDRPHAAPLAANFDILAHVDLFADRPIHVDVSRWISVGNKLADRMQIGAGEAGSE